MFKHITKFTVTFATASLLSACISNQQAGYINPEAADKAIKFAPGVVTTDAFEINAVFNQAGDNVLFARCTNDFKKCTMMESSYEKGTWQAPEALPFSGDYLEADPYYNEDSSWVYFVSKRTISEGGEPSESVNMWRTKKTKDGWQAPEYLPELSSEADDLYPSITSNGDLYFPSFRNNERKMYVAKKTKTGFEAPVGLPTEMFGEGGLIGDSVVLPDGNTIIFSMRRSDSVGKGDLYISTKINGEWTVARSLGDKVNTENHEFTPIVSPDGEYLFFTRVENGVGNIYQIALSALGY